MGEVPGIGELTRPSFPVSALHPPSVNIQWLTEPLVKRGWWVSEKYDGVRACWHSEHDQLLVFFNFFSFFLFLF